MDTRRTLLTIIVALSLGVGVAAGTGVVDPVDAVTTQICEPDPRNVSQDIDNATTERVFNSTGEDDPNVTARRNGTDGDDMHVVDGEDLVRLALQEIAKDTVCATRTDPAGNPENGTTYRTPAV